MRYMNRIERAGPKVVVMNVVPGQLPINRDGYVPVGYLREVNAGRSGRARDMDDRRIALTVYPSRVTRDQAAAWISAPGRTDIEGVDAPMGTATVAKMKTQKTRRAPRRKKPTDYSKAFWDSLDFENDPVGASRMAAEAMEVERMGYHEDMRPLLEDDDYGEIAGSSRWKFDDRAAAEAYRRKRMDDVFMYGTANRKAGKVRSRSAKPFIWRSEGGGAYTISDGNGNTIEMANPGTGAFWYVSAPAWGIGRTRFRTGEEARRFAESLLGVSS